MTMNSVLDRIALLISRKLIEFGENVILVNVAISIDKIE